MPTAGQVWVHLNPAETVVAFAEEVEARAERIKSGGVDPTIDKMRLIT